VGTLASELGGHAQQLSGQPRVYVDANVPAGLVSYMRATLSWDVMFVLEHPDLRRAPDGEHYRLARRLRRTLITLDREVLRPAMRGGSTREADTAPWPEHSDDPLPLEGRKLHVHVDWDGR
jgi:hypothetical protein